MKYLLISLLMISTAFAQSEPVTRIKGDKDTGYKVAPNLVVPNKQATKINSTTVRVETGNGNMLPDPSFESGILPSNTVPTAVGEYGIACEGSGTRGIETNVLANDGTKVLRLMYGAGIGLGVGRCGIYYKVPDNLIGTNVEISFTGAVKYGSTICIRSVQSISPFASQDGNCLTTNDDVADKNKSFVFSITPIYDVVYLYFSKPDGDTATGTYRQAFLDTIHIGKPKSDEAIVAKFDNTTKSEDCGIAASDIVGFGTPTALIFRCSQVGEKLFITGAFTSGASTATLATINIKYRGATLTASTGDSSFFTVVGDGGFGAGSGGSQLKIIVGNGESLIKFGLQSTATGAITPQNGSSIAATGVRVSFYATITISQWSSLTNAAIVACKEGPLKCYDKHIATVTGFSPFAVSQDYPWISSVTNPSTGLYEVNFTSGMYSVPPKCLLSTTNTSDYKATFYQDSTASKVFVKTSGGSTVINSTFTIECTKQGVDAKNPNSTVTPMSDMNDVKSTEWVVGWNHIDSKPIYKMCHKIASNISTDATTIVSWGTGLNPIAPNFGNSSNEFVVFNGSTNAGYYVALYNKTTGNLRTVLSGGYIMRTGSYFCMEYTK